MFLFKRIILSLFVASSALMAAPASQSSIRELLEVAESRKLVDSITIQTEAMMNRSVQQILAGKNPTPKQMAVIEKMKKNALAVMQDTIAWEKLEPMYIRLYEETFNQEEIDGIIAFYKTPAGKALIVKMPTLMQKSMIEMQKLSLEMMPKLQQVQQQFVADMKEASK
ncbi:MAG: DUF2059 domain-containing protein [Sulfuricurvum sp.]|uniref:DUF2059 domain-containing protein n=1 Tax=Sulfuricurvum sp. TaxID=2025608 RepID=UPI00263909C1|nr:DUF2059 domain-containing protein [Sulfuricurvum sp.]MDD2368953.1 DUF2059 domain-containing protein [Sulfuricurvum sp.]MDD2951100.1 DUF2059 domain-containing protein [Sulfuricurvum sp.]MDD5119300.1 DUF2059 domain-containing protein [Sulfuricurvum sp.]